MALFVGHGHGFNEWRINGVEQFMTGSALDDVYRVVDVRRDKVIARGMREDGTEVTDVRIEFPLKPRPTPQLDLSAPRVTARGSVVEGAVRIADADEDAVDVRVGTLEPVTVTLENGMGEYRVDASELGPGMHTIAARLDSEEHGLLIAETGLGISKSAVNVEWIRRFRGGIFATPILNQARLIVASRAGELACLDPVSGTPFWEATLPAGTQSSPTISDNSLVLGTSAGDLLSYDIRTGQPFWSKRLPAPVRSSPTVWNGKVYVGCGDGRMRCFDLRTGEQNWEHNVGRLIESRPAVGMGRVVFGAWDQAVHCLNALTGEELWTSPVGSNVYYSPGTASCLIDNGRAFASAANNTIYGFDVVTGETLWEAEGMCGYTSPIVGPQGTIIYGSMDGTLIGLDPATGEDRFRVDIGPGTFNSGAVLAEGTLAVGSLHGTVTLADPYTGEAITAVKMGSSLMFATPAFDGKRVIAGTMDGSLVCAAVRAGGSDAE